MRRVSIAASPPTLLHSSAHLPCVQVMPRCWPRESPDDADHEACGATSAAAAARSQGVGAPRAAQNEPTAARRRRCISIAQHAPMGRNCLMTNFLMGLPCTSTILPRPAALAQARVLQPRASKSKAIARGTTARSAAQVAALSGSCCLLAPRSSAQEQARRLPASSPAAAC